MLHNVSGKGLSRSLAIVGKRFVLLSTREEEDGRESLHIQRHIIGGTINLGNHNGFIVFEDLSESLVFGCELLAVTTPRGIELKQENN